MKDIEFLEWMLNSELSPQGEDTLTMIEPGDAYNKEQRVVVKNISSSISGMKLYCFNKKDRDFLPFFNPSKDENNKPPKSLRCFCDYILIVQHDNGLFVFLLEMKRGRHDDAEEQLNASRTFFDYILQSAERIKNVNAIRGFNSSTVRYRRVVIHKAGSNKRITKIKDLENIDLDDVIIHDCYDEFRPVCYCR